MLFKSTIHIPLLLIDLNPPTQNQLIPVIPFYIAHFAKVMIVPIIEDINLGIVN